MRHLFLEKNALIIQKLTQSHLDDYSVLIEIHYSFIDLCNVCLESSNYRFVNLLLPIISKIKFAFDYFNNGKNQRCNLYENHCLSKYMTFSCYGHIIAVGKKIKNMRHGDLVVCSGFNFSYYSNVVCVPEYFVVVIDKKVDAKIASVVAWGAFALQGILRAKVYINNTVVVVGLGLIGQLTAQLAKLSGCRVIGIDYVDERIQMARDIGIDYVLNYSSDTYMQDIISLTGNYGIDATFITLMTNNNNNEMIKNIIEIMRYGSKIIVTHNAVCSFDYDLLSVKEIDLLYTYKHYIHKKNNYNSVDYQDYSTINDSWNENANMRSIIDLIVSNKLLIEPLIACELYIEDTINLDNLFNKKHVGVILNHTHKQEITVLPATIHSDNVVVNNKLSLNGLINIGIIGIDHCTQNSLIPFLKKMNNVVISAIPFEQNTVNACEYSVKGAVKTNFDNENNIQYDNFDVVIMASMAQFYFEQAFIALNKGKAVFVQRPIVTTWDQYKQLDVFLNTHKNAFLCVNNMRSFSPFIQKIKCELVDRKSPVVIQYRVSTSNNNINDVQNNAGSVITDAAQIIDIFYFLIDSDVFSLSVESLKSSSDDLFPTDNFSVHISFVDGSLCTLLYTSLGDISIGSERMEVFFDAKTIIMDNYRSLRGFGTSRVFDEVTIVPNFGEAILLQAFFEGMKKNIPTLPISLHRLKKVTELTLIIDQLVCQGGGSKEIR